MSDPRPTRPPTRSIIAIVLGVLAVAAITASFVLEPAWGLRIAALVLIILGLAVGRTAGRRGV